MPYFSPGLVTAAFLIISAVAVVYPNPHYYSEMFVLPVGVLFAFTSIRANLPGAPVGFGQFNIFPRLPLSEISPYAQQEPGLVTCILSSMSALADVSADLYSILPVLVIITLCVS